MPPHAPTPQAAFWLSLLTILFGGTVAAMIAAWTWAIGRFRSGRPLLPDPKPRAVPWGTGSVSLAFLAWLAVNVVVSIAYLRFIGVGKARRMPSPEEQIIAVTLVNLVLLALIPALLRLTSRAGLADFGIELRGAGRQALAGAMGFLLIAPLVYTLNGLAVLVFKQNKHPLEQMVVAQPTVWIAALTFLSAVVLAPAAEELIFRGIIQGWLTKLYRSSEVEEELDFAADPGPASGGSEDGTSVQPRGEVESLAGAARPREDNPYAPPATDPASPVGPGGPRRRDWRPSYAPIVITSGVFGAVHFPQWPAPLAIFFLSIGLGVVYQRTGSLIASFVMHALFNGFGMMMLFVATLAGRAVDPKAVPTATCSATAADAPGEALPPMLR